MYLRHQTQRALQIVAAAFLARVVTLPVMAYSGTASDASEVPAASTTALAPNPPPTLAKVPYGEHPRQVLDFWKAPSTRPTPLVLYIHGGGWVRGDKKEVAGVEKYLADGISVVSINYRYSWQAQLAGVKPPVEWPMHDAARALQFVRSKAAEWNIDKTWIAASGKSAGACSSLWLALHDDMADPNSGDPIARESTRLYCAAVDIAQTSLDPQQMREWTPNSVYGGHAFGFMDPNDLKTRDAQFEEFLKHRDELLPWIKEYSPIEHASADDPPIYLSYFSAPAIGKRQKSPTHTSNFGVKLQDRLKSLRVECELVYPGAADVKHEGMQAFLLDKLKK
jgi:acetyl esterase/lipase